MRTVIRTIGANTRPPRPVDEQLANGFARAFNEAIDSVNSVAMPIGDATGAIVAAVSISGPSQRFTAERIIDAIDILGDAADTVTSRLGGTPVARASASLAQL